MKLKDAFCEEIVLSYRLLLMSKNVAKLSSIIIETQNVTTVSFAVRPERLILKLKDLSISKQNVRDLTHFF